MEYVKIAREKNQFILQNFERNLRSNLLEEQYINFTDQNYSSDFATYEKPPMICEVGKVRNTSHTFTKANVSIDIITMKLEKNEQRPTI